MSRITIADLDGMAERLYRNVVQHNIIKPDEGLWVQRGSRTYGNSFAVIVVGTYPNPPYILFGTYHWGFTNSECYDRMHTACVALEAIPAKAI